MLVLSILHSIFLKKEDARKLYEGEDVVVTGASLPVWYYKKNTSEPAEEVFCKYKLTNNKENAPIIVEDDGYTINLPQDKKEFNLKSILPIEDGGEEYFHFKETNKIKKKNRMTVLIHVVEIKSEELLLKSLD